MTEALSQTEKLAEALSGISISEAARRLAAVSGNSVASERRGLHRWLNGEGISDERAKDLAVALGQEPDYFKRAKEEPSTLLTVNTRLRELETDIRHVAQQVDRILGLLEHLADGPPAQAHGGTAHKKRVR